MSMFRSKISRIKDSKELKRLREEYSNSKHKYEAIPVFYGGFETRSMVIPGDKKSYLNIPDPEGIKGPAMKIVGIAIGKDIQLKEYKTVPPEISGIQYFAFLYTP